MALTPIHIEGLRVHPENFEKIVILRVIADEDMFLPFAIGQAEFDALTIKMQEGLSSQPLTHDLIAQVVQRIGASIDSIVLTDFKNHTFYAKLILKVRGVKVELDCRPSDALNIAISANAPMFADETVLTKASFRYENGVSVPNNPRQRPDDADTLLVNTFESTSAFYNLRLS